AANPEKIRERSSFVQPTPLARAGLPGGAFTAHTRPREPRRSDVAAPRFPSRSPVVLIRTRRLLAWVVILTPRHVVVHRDVVAFLLHPLARTPEHVPGELAAGLEIVQPELQLGEVAGHLIDQFRRRAPRGVEVVLGAPLAEGSGRHKRLPFGPPVT